MDDLILRIIWYIRCTGWFIKTLLHYGHFVQGMDPYPVGMDPYPVGMVPYPVGTDPYPVGMDPYLVS